MSVVGPFLTISRAVVMNWAVLVLSAAVTAGALHLDSSDISQEEWNNYKLRHNKRYSSAEEERERMKTYAENKLMVEQHNEQYERGLTTFTLGLNKFSDRFQGELDRMTTYTIGNYKIPNKAAQTSYLINPLKKEVPNKMDWREKSAVTPVQDQGECATGWAFAALSQFTMKWVDEVWYRDSWTSEDGYRTLSPAVYDEKTGALEGVFAIKNGYLISLSAQNLIECCGSNGCKHGNATQAWDYVHYHGIETEKDYPNKKEVGKCGFKSKKSVMKVDSHLWVDCSNGTALKQAVAVRGPIAAPIAASDAKFRAYQGGVYSVKKCSLKHNHYVLVVGYGTEKMQIGGEEKNVDYWLVKNSWGPGWGIGGYMNLARNGLCGLGEYPLVF